MTWATQSVPGTRASDMRSPQEPWRQTKQPQGRVGRTAAENKHVLGKLGQEVLNLLAENHLAAVEQLLGDAACKGKGRKAFYHSIMHACQKQDLSVKVVMWLADQMETRGMKPNIVTFNLMIGSCLKGLDIDMARKLWDEMLTRGLKPNRITYNIMISASAKSREPTAAEEWLYRMMQDGIKPCTVSYTAVIDSFAKLGNTGSAEAWFTRMEENGEAADDVCFNSVINSCAKAGQLDRAEHWVQRMIKAGIQPDSKTYNCLMHACGRSKVPDLAGRLYAKLATKAACPDASTFSTLIEVCVKSGKASLSYCWLKEMLKHGFDANLMCYDCILHACLEKGDVETAMDLWTLLTSKGLSLDTIDSYNCMIGTFLQVGDPHLALKWVTRMIKAGKQPDSVTRAMLDVEDPKDCTEAPKPSIGATICKLLQAGNFHKVQVCIEQMQRLRLSLSEDLVEEVILACLSASPSRATTRCSTSTSADFQSVQSEEMTDEFASWPELASAESLMQSVLPNMNVTLQAETVTILI